MNILFILPIHIGDSVIVSGAVNAIMQEHADKKPNIWVCLEKPTADLFQHPWMHLFVMNIPPYPQRPACHALSYPFKRLVVGFWKKIATIRLAWKARKIAWELVVDLTFSASSLLRFLKYKEMRNMPIAEKRLGRKIPFATHNALKAAYIAAIDTLQQPKIWLDPALEEQANEIVSSCVPILAISPTSHWMHKEWPIEYFAQLVSKLIAPDGIMAGYSVFITGSLDDRKRCQPLIDALPPHLVIDGFGMSVGMASTIIKRARLFLGNDSAFMHIAAALDVLTLGLFGPTSAERWKPLGKRAYTLSKEDPKTVEDSRDYGNNDLMRKLEPDFVLERIKQIIEADAKMAASEDETKSELTNEQV